jgi:putative membrane protein
VLDMMILIWVLIGFGIYYFIKTDETVKVKFKGGNAPEDILKERYVNGEIDEATFEKMKITINQ